MTEPEQQNWIESGDINFELISMLLWTNYYVVILYNSIIYNYKYIIIIVYNITL